MSEHCVHVGSSHGSECGCAVAGCPCYGPVPRVLTWENDGILIDRIRHELDEAMFAKIRADHGQ